MMSDDRQRDATDLVGELIRRAGPRETPSTDEYDRVLAAATTAFRAKTRQRRRRQLFFALAATVLVGTTATIIVTNLPRPSQQPLARVDRMAGPAEVWWNDESWTAMNGEHFPLFAASRVRTGPDSRLGLRMANDVSVRLAESTDIEFIAPGRIRLLSGKVYADAGAHSAVDEAGADKAAENDRAARRIMVETVVGLAWDIGTQFEVQYVNDVYRLRVREGQVNLRPDLDLSWPLSGESPELRSMAGEQLTIDAARQVQKARIASDDSEWRWTETVAPDPLVDARSVSVLLNWVARQTGRSVEYARPELELEAARTMLYGRVYELEPLEVLDAMLATTDFEYSLLEDGTILVNSVP